MESANETCKSATSFLSPNRLARSFDFVRQLPHAKPNDPWPIADKLPNGYQGVLVVVVVAAVMPNDYHMVVVAVMPIGLRKSAGRKEHKQDKY
jgi:hypothetical protein